MEKRGRKSTASLTVLESGAQARVEPYEDLTDSEKAQWRSIVASKAPDFFDSGTKSLLAEYCRLKSSVDLVAGHIRDFQEEWLLTDEGVVRFKKLTDIRDKCQGRMNAIARSLRLTNQSRFQPVTASTRSGRRSRSSSHLWASE